VIEVPDIGFYSPGPKTRFVETDQSPVFQRKSRRTPPDEPLTVPPCPKSPKGRLTLTGGIRKAPDLAFKTISDSEKPDPALKLLILTTCFGLVKPDANLVRTCINDAFTYEDYTE